MIVASRFSVLLVLCGALLGAAQEVVNVRLQEGEIWGLAYPSHRVWKGIPFAEPPVGKRRWQPPVRHAPWSGVRNATTLQPGCPQHCVLPTLECPLVTSEDCLHTNVWTPSAAALEADPTPRPVMMFIAGGAFFQGTASVPLYDGRFLANRTSVCVVTGDYRLGALGFLVWKDGSGKTVVGGNYGLMDQQLLMEWVRDNIAQFGCDPQRVTLFGESAGAMSIGVHLFSPKSQGLFHAAIMESNPLGLPYKQQSYQSKWGHSFAKHLSCSTLSCLMSKTPDQIATAEMETFHFDVSEPLGMALAWTPTIDGKIVPESPLKAWSLGKAAPNVPIIIGTVQNEGVLFVHEALGDHSINRVEDDAILAALFGLSALKVRLMYPPSSAPKGQQKLLLAKIVTDFVFYCATRKGARALQAYSSQKNSVFQYRFNHVMSFSHFAWSPAKDFHECDDEVCHGSELPFVFAPVSLFRNVSFTQDELALAHLMQDYWGNFARNHTPNAAGVPHWPAIAEGGSSVTMVLQTPKVSIATDYLENQCNMFDSIGYE